MILMGGAAGNSLFLFEEHLLFDNEEDRLATMKDYETTNITEGSAIITRQMMIDDCLLTWWLFFLELPSQLPRIWCTNLWTWLPSQVSQWTRQYKNEYIQDDKEDDTAASTNSCFFLSDKKSQSIDVHPEDQLFRRPRGILRGFHWLAVHTPRLMNNSTPTATRYLMSGRWSRAPSRTQGLNLSRFKALILVLPTAGLVVR